MNRKELSAKQKSALQYGQDMWRISNSYQLAKFLRDNGEFQLACLVSAAIHSARVIAKQNLETRKSLLARKEVKHNG